jgi:hypothetical protein
MEKDLYKTIHLKKTIEFLGEYNPLDESLVSDISYINQNTITGITFQSKLIQLIKYYDTISTGIEGITFYNESTGDINYTINNIYYSENIINYNGTIYEYNSSNINSENISDIFLENEYFLEKKPIEKIEIDTSPISVFNIIHNISLINSSDDIQNYFNIINA